MAEEKNKNEYSTGFGADAFNSLPDFDSLSRVNVEKTEKPVETNTLQNDENEVMSEPQEKAVEKVKKNKGFKIICAVLIVAIVCTVGVSAFNVVNYFSTSYSEKNTEEAGYNAYNEMNANYPSATYPKGIMNKFTKLYAANDEVAGWLYVPGTNINTPVLQNKSDDYYLRHDFFGEYTNYGQTYLASGCKKDGLSKNTVIYGHNMPSGTHFYDINRFEDIEWYKKHPVIKYSTLTGDYTFLIYTSFYATVTPSDDNNYAFNYIYPNMSDSNFEGFIKQVDERALYKTGVSLKRSDKVICVSTCNHTYDGMCGKKVDTRLVVIGRLLRGNESENVDTSKTKENPDYRKPQVYYSHVGKTNPYAKSAKWQPSSK